MRLLSLRCHGFGLITSINITEQLEPSPGRVEFRRRVVAATARQARLPRIAWNGQRAGWVQCGNQQQHNDYKSKQQGHPTRHIHWIASLAVETLVHSLQFFYGPKVAGHYPGQGSQLAIVSITVTCDRNHTDKTSNFFVRLGLSLFGQASRQELAPSKCASISSSVFPLVSGRKTAAVMK